MVDNLFHDFCVLLRGFPSVIVSVVTFLFCGIFILFAKRFFGFAGLCVYISLSTILANIQILYATSYEIIDMPVLLGTVTFSSVFLASDVINEKYGPEKARQATILSFFVQVCFFVNIMFTIGHKPLDYSVFKDFSISKEVMDQNMQAINQIFIPVPRLLIASYIAYLASQFTEIWAFNAVKKIKIINSKYIKHNLALTLSSIFVDNLIFTPVGLVFLSDNPLSMSDCIDICLSAVFIKLICNFGNTYIMQIGRKYFR